MKKLIFILIAMLFVISCRNDRDSNNKNKIEIDSKYYSKMSAKTLFLYGKVKDKPNDFNGSIDVISSNDVYFQVNKLNIVYLKVYNSLYSGAIIESPIKNSFIFIDNNTKLKIQILDLNPSSGNFKINGISTIVDYSNEYNLYTNSFKIYVPTNK
ncbi:hypothetical protein [Elizabethkingia miricola]|uniref:Lipoprotein n=3 Tax=Elizabethkingia miricola TaxID=172045 RepID=A0ABD5B485_ELIMR|nr:hypothetical protein [Elizabethkingia miricola]MDQ8748201.1 hypothetical protein [Elizabethkingia miricola]OPB87911.1 hypothetical protein BAS06_12005 [Elizabethkingia miricola]PSL88703.1 hypothetical protein C7V10_08555 [Elizabethkingia miricola]QHQ86128.1 hypothetical protein FE632_04730 [Elizabethkingia miricola]UIO97398.1 hypothetical protein LYZ41_04760 [Elizabethkingia miricola]